MFATHWIEQCGTCGEKTPHSRRIGSAAEVISLIFGVEGLCLILVGPWPAGVASMFVGLVIFLRGREKSWHIRCERCRWKKVRAISRTKPTLDGNTEINIF